MIYLYLFLETFVFEFTVLTARAGKRMGVDCCVVYFVKGYRGYDMG
jgi:hypothetical protein